MSKVERFEDIKSWQKARKLVNRIYDISDSGYLSRDYGLRDQIRRASISIISNISEGFERDGDKEFIQFLSNAKGSCGEVRTQLYILKDRGYIEDNEFKNLYQMTLEINRMISGLMKYLKTSNLKGKKYKDP